MNPPSPYTPVALELSRLSLASLTVWLAVACLVIGEMMPPAMATAAALPPASRVGLPIAAIERERTEEVEPTHIEVTATPLPVVLTVAAKTVADSSTTPSRFMFPDDIGGKLLSEKLTPPARFDLLPLPFIGEPKAWRSLRFDPLPRDLVRLTPALVPPNPRLSSLPARAGLSAHSQNLPGLPREIALALPSPISVQPLPRLFVPSADPNGVMPQITAAGPPKEKIDPGDDPARRAADEALFRLRLLPVTSATLFVNLVLADPFEQIRAVRLTHAISDLDPSLFPAGRPAQPHFPIIELPTAAAK